MKVTELNPNHPVTEELHAEWQKVAAALLLKLAPGKRVILDLQDFQKVDGLCVVVSAHADHIELYTVTMEEAVKLATKEGGKPV